MQNIINKVHITILIEKESYISVVF